MKTNRLLPVILLVIMSSWMGCSGRQGVQPVAQAHGEPAVTHDDHHHHDGAVDMDLSLNEGEKWDTDEALRAGMIRIRNIMQESLPAAHARTLSSAQYQTVAQSVDGEVQTIFAECDLPPDADAVLHVLLARIMGATSIMQSGQDERDGFVRIVKTLDAYAAYFHHPGWEPLSTPH